MNWLTRHMNPLTLERLKRFRRMKRAWWSFVILLGAYLLSLGAELICNSSPLYVRYAGKSYFPVFRYYPETIFTGSGRLTRPNYRAIAASPEFRRNPGNKMVFPLIPYGPNEILDPSSISVANTVEVTIRPVEHAASINIGSDYVVQRGQDAGFFFKGSESEVEGKNLADFYAIGEGLRNAVAVRFGNQAAGRYQEKLKSKDGREVIVSMPSYAVRSRPPRSLRLTLREIPSVEAKPESLFFTRDRKKQSGHSDLWEKASPEERTAIADLVGRRFNEPFDTQILAVAGENRQVLFTRTDVRWPFRPVSGHPLGIDGAGRDVLARIIYGFRISMSFGLLLVVFSMAAGIVIGAVQGYFGGRIDISAQRLIEIWSALPFLYIMILLGSVFGRSFLLLLIVYAIFNWISLSYYMRAEFLRLRKFPFVEAAKCLGVPTYKIVFQHIFPNALVPVITFFPFSLVGAIGSLAALDYLGFGMPPPTASWGELLNQAQEFSWAWWLILYPALVLFVVMLLGVFMGEGIRNAFDPRSYNKIV